jgi:predicted MFS family arabinose efflux permease
MPKGESAGNVSAKTPGYAWLILVMVYLLSVSAAMLWFSCPPMAGSIIGAYIVQLGSENINANFGMLMTYVAIGAIVAALVAIFLQNKLGIKVILLISAVFLVAGAAIAAVSGTSFTMLSLSRIIAGVGIGFVAVSATTAISMWFNDDKRALAMALWATWVPISMLIEYNIVVPICSASDFHTTWWFITGLSVVSLLLIVFAYKMPPANGQISNEQTSLSEGLKFIKKRQVICLMVCMFLYNFVSHGFTTFNPSFFTETVANGGMGWDDAFANMIASFASAAGIIGPVFGAISDKIKFKSKYVMIVIGAIGYVLACVFGFKNLGTPVFVLYMVCMVLANGIMVACLRPMMPMLVGRGGVTAVTLGLALFTVLEFGGQLFTNFYGSAMDAFGYATASLAVGVPVAVLLVICAALVKPDRELIEANEHAPAQH